MSEPGEGYLAFIFWPRTSIYTVNSTPVKISSKIEFQNGDIIFQTSMSNQSKAIQLATNSRYSHMGIIYENEGQYYVYEAIQPVKLTPLEQWIKRGENGENIGRPKFTFLKKINKKKKK